MGGGARRRRRADASAASFSDDGTSFQRMVDYFHKRLDKEINFSDQRRSSIPTHTITERADGVQSDRTHVVQGQAAEMEKMRQEIEILKLENDKLVRTPGAAVQQNLFNFKDLEESLTKFSGDDSYPVEKWISSLNETSNVYGWTDMQTTVYAKRLLVGTAKQSLRIIKDVDTWEKLSEFLLAEFRSSDNSAVIHKKMATRKKKTDETFKGYLVTMRELGLTGNIEDAAIIQYVIDGIDDYEPNKAVLYGTSDMLEFKKKLSIYEEVRSKIKSRNPFLVDNKPGNSSNNNNGTKNNPSNNNSSSENIKKRYVEKCFVCGENGHYGRDCPNKKKRPRCYNRCYIKLYKRSSWK